jgi:DNA-binding CsgD family transcriptional regulator
LNLESDFDLLVGAIYQAAMEPEGWPEVLAAISARTGNSTLYICHDPLPTPAKGFIWTHNFDPDSLAAYKRDYAGPQYSGLRVCAGLAPGQLIDRRAYFDDDAYFNDPGHRAFLANQGLAEVLVGPTHRDRQTISVLICGRTASQGALSSDQLRFLHGLVPHIARSMAIQQRLAGLDARVGLLADALAGLKVGVLSVTASMEVLFANTEAERILAAADGLAWQGGKLVVHDLSASGSLKGCVARLSAGIGDTDKPCLFLQRPSRSPPITVVVAPAFRNNGAAGGSLARRAGATLYITDPAGPAALPAPSRLENGLGLTASEAEVARLAAMGRGMGFVAERLGISLNTARTHLKSGYAKTGVNHQVALARTIADRFPPVRGLNSSDHGEPRR